LFLKIECRFVAFVLVRAGKRLFSFEKFAVFGAFFHAWGRYFQDMQIGA
jgi:hypothetical protein